MYRFRFYINVGLRSGTFAVFFIVLFYLLIIILLKNYILEDHINDTLKDDRNRSWRVILFVLKPKRGFKCFIVPTNHITGN